MFFCVSIKRLQPLLWGMILLWGGGAELHAQWQMDMKNRLGTGGTNAQLLLAYEAPTEAWRQFEVKVNLRREGEVQVFISKEMILEAYGSEVFIIGYQLPAGAYDIDASIYDPDLDRYYTLERSEPFYLNRRREILLSDIFLSAQAIPDTAFRWPLVGPPSSHGLETLYYYQEIYAPEYDQLSLRAVLYQEKTGKTQGSTAAYVSLQQRNLVLYPRGRQRVIFGDTLHLGQLEPGQYMVQILVYDDDYRLGDEQIRFEVKSDIQTRIYADLETSIKMMKYLLQPEALIRLLDVSGDETVQAEEFRNTWRSLYRDRYQEEMEAYYRKVYEAAERFPEGDIPGWDTDRGSVFVQYGEPREKVIERGGKTWLRWTYARWSLSFLFEQRNQGYFLVE
ncbi:MAG: GWxTD domain-containing protein [Bacteroidetes bacterium]|nr:MAG: GWxTD domain-containing protein [Bacteroidota bacterium]